MKGKLKILGRVGLFSIIFVLLFCFLNIFFQPVWLRWNNYHTTYGFYEEPENTIETVFLGPSVVISGLSPMEMYSEYGLCTYNLATEQQPMLASYYWLEEAYRLHGETLKTVVLDVSELREDSTEAFYHKALDGMRLSAVKCRAAWEYADGDVSDALSYLLPLNAYHDRWSELESSDFDKFSYDIDTGTRGCLYDVTLTFRSTIDKTNNVKVLNPTLDETAQPESFDKRSLAYLDKMAAFCKEKGICLVLIKTPSYTWTSACHNAVVARAEELELDFLDFNFDPLYSDIDYIHAYDSMDSRHLNYFGGTKLSHWLGQYLVETCGATDVRGKEAYAFLETQYAEYETRVLQGLSLQVSESIEEYLDKARSGDNTIFILVKDEASRQLTQAQRDYFQSIGLEGLASLGFRDSYIGVVDDGAVVYEKRKVASGEEKPLTYQGRLPDKTEYYLVSGGHGDGKIATCTIDGTDHAVNTRGINVVVYSNDLDTVIHQAVFDTFTSSATERYSLELSDRVLADLDGVYDPDSVAGRIIAYQAAVAEKASVAKAEMETVTKTE